MAGRNPFEWVRNFVRGPHDEYETPPPPQTRPDVRAPNPVGATATDRYRVEEGRITQERPGRLDTSGATEPREGLPDALKAAETQEYTEAIRRGLTETRDKEAEVVENRYGRGVMGAFRGFNQWLNETDTGRIVKIGGKVVGGLSAAACAGFLVGTGGILIAPVLGLLGKKYAINGAIEAFQYFGGARRNPETGQLQIGGRERLRRLDIEAGRQRRANLELLAQNAATEHAAGRLSAEEYRTFVLDVVRDIKQNEETVLQNDREYEDIRNSNQRIRGWVSTGATIVLGLLDVPMGGVSFGIQDLDKDGAEHAVKGTIKGIEWIQGNAQEVARNFFTQFGDARGLVAGVGSNAANLAGTMDQFWQLAGGVGVAMTGLAASTMRELGAFSQGSRARIRELLSENVRVEDGVVAPLPLARPTTSINRGPATPTTTINRGPTTTINAGPARPTTAINRAPTTTINMGPARPTTSINRGPATPTTTINSGPTTTTIDRATTTINSGPAAPTTDTERARPTTTTERPTTTAVETEGRFAPLTGKEIQEMPGAAQELRTTLLNRIGAENVPSRMDQEQFTTAFGEWLQNASASAVERARVFFEDSLKNYEQLSTRNEARRAALLGALEQIAANVRERAANARSRPPEQKATTAATERPPTTAAVERGGQLGSLRGNLKIETFFESGNALFKKDLLRTLQGAGPDTAVETSAMAIDQWLGSLDGKQLKRLDSYLDKQQKAAEKNKDSYTGETGREDLYNKNLKSLQSLRDRIGAIEQVKKAA